jgi:FecR protein
MNAKTITKVAGFFLAALLSASAWGASADQPNAVATPGTVNYVEGQVSIGQQVLDSNSIGSAKLEPNQFLFTGTGKAEVLLTPGVFLRVGDNSSVQMVLPDLTNTQVALVKGEATVEVTQIQPENNIQVTVNGATTQLLKRGLYDIDADNGVVRVFEGEADVTEGSRRVKVKAGHEVSTANNTVSKETSFDKSAYESSDLYRWTSLRSSYLAEANADAAPLYVDGADWYGAGWYWDPWYGAYTFIPGDGIFYSPFGWGFYSPFYAGWAPFGWGYGFGYYGHYHHQFGPDYHGWGTGPHYNPGVRGGGLSAGPGASGFHGGGGFRGGSFGGGFHGGGGGFHGGGGFGGGHGR